MFSYQTTIKMHNIDAAGRLFFADQFVIAHDAWEACLDAKGLSISAMLEQCSFVTPVVHAEADYQAPVTVGEVVTVNVSCEAAGKRSFTIGFAVMTEVAVGQGRHVHAVVDKVTGEAIAIPDSLRDVLDRI